MSYTPALLTLLETTLAPTGYCVGDMLDHGMGDWHASVLLDNTDHLLSLEPQALNDRDFAGHTPLDIAYRLNRIFLIEGLEALGAMGDKAILESRGVGSFIENDKYVHLPGKQGKLKTLEKRYLEGGSLNDRDVGGNTPTHLSSTDTYKYRSASWSRMVHQRSEVMNFQHGQTYLTPSISTAVLAQKCLMTRSQSNVHLSDICLSFFCFK